MALDAAMVWHSPAQQPGGSCPSDAAEVLSQAEVQAVTGNQSGS